MMRSTKPIMVMAETGVENFKALRIQGLGSVIYVYI